MAWLAKLPAVAVATRLRAFVLGVLSLPVGVELAQWALGVEILRKLCGS